MTPTISGARRVYPNHAALDRGAILPSVAVPLLPTRAYDYTWDAIVAVSGYKLCRFHRREK